MNNYKYDTFVICTYHDINEAKNKNEDIDFYVEYGGKTYFGSAEIKGSGNNDNLNFCMI